mgnify:CR=1 FL=1
MSLYTHVIAGFAFPLQERLKKHTTVAVRKAAWRRQTPPVAMNIATTITTAAAVSASAWPLASAAMVPASRVREWGMKVE